jgi:multiple sugar transport system permease protein
MAFTVWMMKGFFEEVPLEIEESAMVDGCSYMQSFIMITIPTVRSGLVSTVIFSFILSWNDFMYALVLTGSKTRLVPVAVAQFLTPHGMFWGQMCAAGIIAILPILLFSLFTRKYLIRGMSLGAIK